MLRQASCDTRLWAGHREGVALKVGAGAYDPHREVEKRNSVRRDLPTYDLKRSSLSIQQSCSGRSKRLLRESYFCISLSYPNKNPSFKFSRLRHRRLATKRHDWMPGPMALGCLDGESSTACARFWFQNNHFFCFRMISTCATLRPSLL